MCGFSHRGASQPLILPLAPSGCSPNARGCPRPRACNRRNLVSSCSGHEEAIPGRDPLAEAAAGAGEQQQQRRGRLAAALPPNVFANPPQLRGLKPASGLLYNIKTKGVGGAIGEGGREGKRRREGGGCSPARRGVAAGKTSQESSRAPAPAPALPGSFSWAPNQPRALLEAHRGQLGDTVGPSSPPPAVLRVSEAGGLGGGGLGSPRAFCSLPCAALGAARIQEAGARRVPSRGCTAAKPLLVFSSRWSQRVTLLAEGAAALLTHIWPRGGRTGPALSPPARP